MFRQSPSRKRSNGFKVKHGLQIFLLVAICFWLLYQVKHSHDKKKAFDESSMKLSLNLDNEHEITKLGRKDLQPRLEEKTTVNEIQGKEEEIEGDEEENKSEIEEENKPEEEEEEKGSKPEEEKENRLEEEEEEEKENKPEEEEEEEEEKENKPEEEEEEENKSDEEEQDKTKHADEEAEGGETKHEENETQGRDDGIDEQDQETAEEEAEREEKFVDEEENSRKEETEEGEKEEKIENAGSSDDLDRDRNTQEAREENYKRDDASSAVFRESGNSGDSTEKELLESTGKIKLELNNTSNIERITSDENNPDQKTVSEKTESTPSVNVVVSDDKGNEVSQINSPITKSDDQQEESSSSGTGNMNIASSFLQNGTNITSELTSGQTNEMESATEDGSKLEIVNHAENSNITTGTENSSITTGTENSNITTGTENSNITTGTENSDSNPAVLTTTENVDVTKREFSDTSNIADPVVVSDEQTGKSISTAGEDNGSLSTETHENESGGQNEKAESGAQNEKAETTDGNKEADDSKASLTTNERTEVVTNDPINHLIPLEEKDARTDLGTLPETVTKGTNRDNEAVE